MKRVVEREKNKAYYRMLHLPVWIWVFFVLPGHLTYDLFLHGPDRRHWIWLVLVTAVCIWRGQAGRLPGVEPQPYITHWGVEAPNLPYRVVCYAAAWIDLLVPFVLNLIGLVAAAITGRWMLQQLYFWFYYPFALAVVLATWMDWIPRTRRSTAHEGAERAWFYVAIWTAVASQLAGWVIWRLGARLGMGAMEPAGFRLAAFLAVAGIFVLLGLGGKLGRTPRYYAEQHRMVHKIPQELGR